MRFPLIPVQGEPAAETRRNASRGGFSLLEVLMIIAMLSVTILPFTLLMSQTAGNARGAYLQSSRSILLNSIMDEATVDRNYYVPYYNNTLNTTVSESGQVLPYRRVVDTSASNVFKKTVYFYLYNDAADAASAPRYKTKMTFKRDVMRVRFNGFSTRATWVDNSGQEWDHFNIYHESSASDSVPGITSGAGLNDWYDGTAVVNLPSSGDAELYQNGFWKPATPIYYSADVPNGLYTVKLYFTENGPTGRLMDITIENKLMNPGNPFSAYLRCGNRNFCGNIQMFDVMVTDGVLNVQLSANSAATNTDPFINGITIIKRT